MYQRSTRMRMEKELERSDQGKGVQFSKSWVKRDSRASPSVFKMSVSFRVKKSKTSKIAFPPISSPLLARFFASPTRLHPYCLSISNSARFEQLLLSSVSPIFITLNISTFFKQPSQPQQQQGLIEWE
ncbi:hypothetical protein JCM5350_007028 [Sporobolomyces pararoseus]